MANKQDDLQKLVSVVDEDVKDMISSLPAMVELDDIEEEEPERVVYTPIVDATPKVPMTTVERAICDLFSTGKSTKAIADEVGVSVGTVRTILGKPHIKDFVNELVNAQYTVQLEGRLRIINKIVDDKLEELELNHGGNLAHATKKDLVDLLVIEDNMLKERQKKELGTNDNVYLNIIQQITKD